MKKNLLLILAIGAFLTGMAIIPLVGAYIRGTAVQVYQLTPHAPEAVSVNLDMWNFDTPDPAKTPDYDHQLMKIYGIPNEKKDVLVLIDKSKLVYPAGQDKRPDLVFLPVDKQKGDEPLQLKTVDFVSGYVRIGAWIVGMVFIVLHFVFKKIRERASRAPGV